MEPQEKHLIDGLFQRIKETEKKGEPRDVEAERQIRDFIQQQPAAPYYMAQSILVQEAALNRLNQKVQTLQNEITHLKMAQQPGNRGFFKGLFGTGRAQIPPKQQTITPQIFYNEGHPNPTIGAARGNSFISGALQTAAGVAGGMVLGNMLTTMFHHSGSDEIANAINDHSLPISGGGESLLGQNFDSRNMETFNNISERNFFDQNDTLSNDGFSSDYFSNENDGFF